jgi:hypothetical protein
MPPRHHNYPVTLPLRNYALSEGDSRVESPEETVRAKRRLSGEAWVSIGAIGAAVITGVVTLLVHVIPGPGSQSTAASGAVSMKSAVSPATSQTTGADSSPIAQMIGSWKGTASSPDGTVFPITLDITQPCGLKEFCGSIAVPYVPCYGDVFLESVNNGDVEFRVRNFKAGSSPKCTPGAGEHFHLKSDGLLDYYASYSEAHGTLEKA